MEWINAAEHGSHITREEVMLLRAAGCGTLRPTGPCGTKKQVTRFKVTSIHFLPTLWCLVWSLNAMSCHNVITNVLNTIWWDWVCLLLLETCIWCKSSAKRSHLDWPNGHHATLLLALECNFVMLRLKKSNQLVYFPWGCAEIEIAYEKIKKNIFLTIIL